MISDDQLQSWSLWKFLFFGEDVDSDWRMNNKGKNILTGNFFFFEDVEKKVRLKSPKLHTPRKVGTCPPPPLPKMRESWHFQPQPHPTMWLRRGPGCRRPSNPWAVGPNSPLSPAPTCRVGLTISSPLVFPPTLRWESLRVQWGARNNLRRKVCGVPAVQWRPWTRVANPENPGKGGQCSPLP